MTGGETKASLLTVVSAGMGFSRFFRDGKIPTEFEKLGIPT